MVTLKSPQIRTELLSSLQELWVLPNECFTDEMIPSCWSLSNSASTFSFIMNGTDLDSFVEFWYSIRSIKTTQLLIKNLSIVI